MIPGGQSGDTVGSGIGRVGATTVLERPPEVGVPAPPPPGDDFSSGRANLKGFTGLAVSKRNEDYLKRPVQCTILFLRMK